MGMAQLVVTAVAGRGPFQERGRPRVRGLAPLGDHVGAAVPRRGPDRSGTPLTTPTLRNPLRTAGRRRGRDRRATQGPRPRRARSRRGDHRVPPSAPPRPRPGRFDDLADPLGPRVHHPAAAQTPEKQLPADSAAQPNERWQLDITHWTPGRRQRCGDPQSARRPLPTLCRQRRPAGVHRRRRRRHLRSSLQLSYGDPAAMLSDNGACSPAPPPSWARRPRGRPHLTRHPVPPFPALPSPDLRQDRTVPPDPEEAGSPTSPRARTMRQLQAQLDSFRIYYNTSRPHRALGRRTPSQAFHARPKAGPTGLPLDDAHYRIRHDTIDPSGVFTLRHNSRLHHIGIGRRHAGTRVLILVHDLPHPGPEPRRRTPTRTAPRPDQGLPATAVTVTMSRDTCARCPATSHWCPWQDSNLQPAV